MNSPELQQIVFDFATYTLVAFFLCFFFISWYLRKHEDPDSEVALGYTNWVILLFRYRDFTRSRFGKVHFVYYLTLIVMAAVILLFTIAFIFQLQTVPSPMKYIVAAFIVVIISFILGIFRHMGKTIYYE